jgi:hypothetical protein
MLRVARDHLSAIEPGLEDAPLRLHTLDGPPGSPRYAVSVSRCRRQGPCPYDVVDEQLCSVHECAQREALRMLLNRDGEVVEIIRDGLRWDS